MKKQLEETIPESTKQLPFSSLRSEIEYFKEENRTKTLIIKQLTENKSMTSSCSCNEVSTSKDHAGKNNKECANSLENNEKSNKNLNQTKKSDEKTLTQNHNTENKDSNEKKQEDHYWKKRTMQRTKILKKTKTLRKKRPKTTAVRRTRRLRRKTRKVKRKVKRGKINPRVTIAPGKNRRYIF